MIFNKTKNLILKHKKKCILLFILLVWYYFSLPKQLFNSPTSTIIESKEHYLLGAKIAKDGQWRFPEQDSIPQKFKQCIIQFEDAYFYKHVGFNPISMSKALVKNIKNKGIKRGGSTLTQQVIRLSRNGKKRTYFEKIKEIILATRLEFKHSKEKILSLYTNHAPFGGNVVGLEAASWRYYGRKSYQLSWAETATLAVLPNAPSLIYPGKNQQRLLMKRNRLLKKLEQQNIIDQTTYKLAILEQLPQKPFALPQIANHLLEKVNKEHTGKRVITSIQYRLQQQINQLANQHYQELKQNEIFNLAVLVLDVKTRKVMAYVGNSPTTVANQKDVDIITKPRSTGSILKPFLYTAMLDQGELLPKTLVADVPTQFGSYHPLNFNKTYDGAVHADRALSRSLNIPAVNMLKQFKYDRFYYFLQKMEFKDINKGANHYGLTMILGGAEASLWDICKNYASLSATLNNYDQLQAKYYTKEFIEPSYLADQKLDFGKISTQKTLFDAGSIYLTFEALNKVNRPEGSENWEFFDNSTKLAWKTGTSFGFRDAWAIGTNSNYVVGVWVGNADGEGRPGLIGIETAAPILFNVVNKLPKSNWYTKPYDELSKISVCKNSGYRNSKYCNVIDTVYVQRSGLKTKVCPFHKQVHLDQTKNYQVNANCYELTKMETENWFVLPPLMEYYYKQKNPFYKTLPLFLKNCQSNDTKTMDFIYPKERKTSIYLPKNFSEKKNEFILKLTHKDTNAKVFWYVNEEYIKTTETFHEIGLQPKKGNYIITAVDKNGNTIHREIEIKE